LTVEARRRSIENGRGEIIQFVEEDRLLTAQHLITRWRDDEAFRDVFVSELAATTYPGFFWELPPLSKALLEEPFECAVIWSDALAHMRADPSDFADQLKAASGSVTSFHNLGRDALLIVPSRVSSADCYGHFAAFVRDAPREQQHALFRLLADEAARLLEAGRRFWISTSGLGVPWVHVRLDNYPKYYQYRPYAEA
jgi:hypothetical protein